MITIVLHDTQQQRSGRITRSQNVREGNKNSEAKATASLSGNQAFSGPGAAVRHQSCSQSCSEATTSSNNASSHQKFFTPSMKSVMISNQPTTATAATALTESLSRQRSQAFIGPSATMITIVLHDTQQQRSG
jgi:hypothetical protein